jgi:hypothetical protein
MRKSYSKIRHIQESNTLLENRRRTIMEQVPPAPAPAPTPPTPAPAPAPVPGPNPPAPVPGPNPPAPVSQEVADCTPGVTGSLDANGMLTKPDGTKCKVVCLSGTPPTAG